MAPKTPPDLPADGLLDGEEQVDAEIVLYGDGSDPGAFAPGTFRKIGSGMVVLVICIVATYLVPALHWARPWTSEDPVPFWNVIGRELMGEGAEVEAEVAEVQRAEELAARLEDDLQLQPPPERTVIEPPADPSQGLPPYEPHPDDAEEVTQPLDLPTPDALDSFFAKLARTDAGYAGEITRVSQWGDSAIANDHVTSALRFEMQQRFGDAGPGFHLLARPNPSYRHAGIRFTDDDKWERCYIINKCRADGRYGLGGTTVWSGGGVESRFRTEAKLPFGRKWSRFELWYLQHPKGGRVRIDVDSAEPVFVDTAAAETRDAWHAIDLTHGPHDIRVRAVGGGGTSRLYGVVMESEAPGVVWDGLEQLGAFTGRLLYFDEAHLRDQLAHRDPDLIVFMFGGNDLTMPLRKHEQLRRQWVDVLTRFRADEPERACLVMSPIDHGVRRGPQIVSVDLMEPMVALMKEVALAEGCAFFDTYRAMGGEGSAGRWRKTEQPLLAADLSHLNDAGQRVIGHLVYLALMREYVAYRQRASAASP
jgi:lysophospholipase L1-like esterase